MLNGGSARLPPCLLTKQIIEWLVIATACDYLANCCRPHILKWGTGQISGCLKQSSRDDEISAMGWPPSFL